MGGANVVDYLIDDPNSFHNSIFDYFIGNKQPDLDYCHLLFKIGHNIGWRLTALSSQGV